MLDPTLDVKDIAAYLKISVYTVKNRLRSGQLRGYKQGGNWRIKREWLLAYERLLTGEAEQ
ncbi:helix-turn-helix domain-containing protein [Cohnella yongneupensis]|uniref:Helix-turn-helix domain-containing protein n=1 Tax=Cohnella yongneupensis TaxID=425006 RepID=A0ABW0R5N1_9BACL